jgi:Do/DeqQ family serine protease
MFDVRAQRPLSTVRTSALRLTAALLLGCAALTPILGRAALPSEMDGQPLPSLAPMLESVTPAVVNVHSQTRVQVRDPFFNDPFFRRFFDTPDVQRERIQQSLGSGVIVDAREGLVLTNNHVIEGADDIKVTLTDGRTLNAQVVGRDPDTDLAVIRIPPERLTAVKLANTDQTRVGDFVVAVGNPFGLGQTVTSGIVSALGRSGLRGLGYQNFIQTDASINPGNSGGALVNLRGELIGINTAIFSPSGGNVGIGFAVPANLARNVMQQLLAYGEVQRGSLGVQAQDLTEELAAALALRQQRGAVVTQIVPDSPAAKSGLRIGDVIVQLGSSRIAQAQDLANAEGLLPIGEALSMKVLRDGRSVDLRFTLAPLSTQKVAGAKLDPRLSGITLSELPRQHRDRGVRGVLIADVDPQSPAGQSGLKRGDILAGVNRYGAGSLAELTELLGQRPRQLLLTIYRGGRGYILQL